MSSMLILALAVKFPPLIALCVLTWLKEKSIGVARTAETEVLSATDKAHKALRIIRKTSVEEPPTPDEIRAAWAASRRSLGGKLLAGTLLSNLEPVVDQSYIRDVDGTIVGRRAGIKGWLSANCPDMVAHYKALMNYKALADKLRLVLGVEEPDTLSGVLDFGSCVLDVEEGILDVGGGRRDAPKSLQIKQDVNLFKSNEKTVVSNVHEINEEMGRRGGGWTMAAMEEVLRGRLGLVWMRRSRRRALAA